MKKVVPISIVLASAIAGAALASQAGPNLASLPPAPEFSIEAAHTRHLAEANRHMEEAAKALAWVEYHVHEAHRETSLASSMKPKGAK